jgi:hypothetical protein
MTPGRPPKHDLMRTLVAVSVTEPGELKFAGLS